jgi:predicted nucleic acid-binding protein
VILFDTNVVLDLFLDREPFSLPAAQLFTFIETGKLSGCICATTATTVHYLSVKVAGSRIAREHIKKLLTLFEIAPVNRSVLETALKLKFRDFEDAVVHEAARQMGAQGIVTRNTRDFKIAKISIYTPEELLHMLHAAIGTDA